MQEVTAGAVQCKSFYSEADAGCSELLRRQLQELNAACRAVQRPRRHIVTNSSSLLAERRTVMEAAGAEHTAIGQKLGGDGATMQREQRTVSDGQQSSTNAATQAVGNDQQISEIHKANGCASDANKDLTSKVGTAPQPVPPQPPMPPRPLQQAVPPSQPPMMSGPGERISRFHSKSNFQATLRAQLRHR